MAENICPYLGSVDDPLSCSTSACEDNLCYASGEGEVVSNSTQKRICLGGKLSSCSRFPSEPTLAVLSETAAASSSTEDEQFEVVEEPDSVPVGGMAAFDPADEEEYEISEEQDFDETVFQRAALAAERDDPPEDIYFDALDAGSDDGLAGTVADDFYFDELDQADSAGESESAPADEPVVHEQANRTIRMAPVAAREPDISRHVAQETLAGEELSVDGGLSPSPLPDRQAQRFFQPMPVTTEGGQVDVQDTTPVQMETSSSVYDPTVVLPVVSSALATPGTDLPIAATSAKGLPEPAVSHPSESVRSPNGIRSQKERAGVDPNWLARHTAAQAARGEGDRPAANVNHQASAGTMPEVVLRPAPIRGAARPTTRPVDPLAALQDQPVTPAPSGRPKTFLYLSLSTVMLALLLVCGGSFLVYDSLLADQQGMGIALLGSSPESVAWQASPTADTATSQPTPQATSIPTEDLDFSALPSATRQQDTAQPTPVTATESAAVVAMAPVTDTPKPIPTSTPAVEQTLTPSPSPTTKATVSPTSTAKPTETETATYTATATQTSAPTATSTVTTEPAATATSTQTASPTQTSTATSRAEPTQTSTPTATATAPATATPAATATPRPTDTATVGPSPAGMSAAGEPSGDEASQLYIISEGDTLYAVALEYGITLDTLIEMNPGLDSQFLSIGQEIRVPKVEPTSTPAATATGTSTPTNTVPAVTPMTTVTIQEGDTLSVISEQYGVSVELLLQANPELQPQRLQIGQEIVIPSLDATIAPTPTLTATSTQTPKAPLMYVIEPGDMLSTVAEEYGVTVDEIIASNPDVDPRRMAVGQELKIPTPGNGADSEPTATVQATMTREPGSSTPDRIVAPSIGLDAEVVAIDSHKETQDGVEVTVWEEPEEAAGFHKGSSQPGEGGNVVISGEHNSRGEVFRDIAELAEGSEITVYAGGQAYEYEVDQVLIVPHEHISAAKRQQNENWLEDTSEERVTLISYWPYENSTHWVVIVAKP